MEGIQLKTYQFRFMKIWKIEHWSMEVGDAEVEEHSQRMGSRNSWNLLCREEKMSVQAWPNILRISVCWPRWYSLKEARECSNKYIQIRGVVTYCKAMLTSPWADWGRTLLSTQLGLGGDMCPQTQLPALSQCAPILPHTSLQNVRYCVFQHYCSVQFCPPMCLKGWTVP